MHEQAFKTDTQSSANFAQCPAHILLHKTGSTLGAVYLGVRFKEKNIGSSGMSNFGRS
ncbi:MAG: hypothetical protein KJ630_10415 [Proteobacteria bacterium]|nr:hypothetical protein [Pseudomonadota bacterium]